MANRQELLHLLDQGVFSPIIKASLDGNSETERKRPDDLQDRAQSEKEPFHWYSSARRILANNNSDLHSPTSRQANSKLEELNLASLPFVDEVFIKLMTGKEKAG